MPNESLITYSVGQQLKAESFTLQVGEDWSSIMPDPVDLSSTAIQTGKQSLFVEEQPSIEDQLGAVRREVPFSPVIPPKFSTVLPSSTLKTKQFWEGTVISCEGSTFVGRMVDRTNPSNPEEVVEFESDEITDDERALIAPGAGFYWTVGIERTYAGVKNVAIVNFRRTPRWNKVSIQKASNRAKEIASFFEQE